MPSWVTRKQLLGKDGRAVGTAPPATVDVTPGTPGIQDINPYWTKDEQNIYFQSDRKLAADQVTHIGGGLFHIWRTKPDGTGVAVPITGPEPTTPVGAAFEQFEPSVNPGQSKVLYVERYGGAASSDVDLIELNLNTGQTLSLLKGKALDANGQSITFTALNHPEYAANIGYGGIIFAGTTAADPHYHVYVVDTNTSRVTQLTTGVADDKNPTVSPADISGTHLLIAFDSNRGDAQGTIVAPGNHRDIWVRDTNPTSIGNNFRKVTNFTAAAVDNIEPAWSTNKIDRPFQAEHFVQGGILLAFASTRYDPAGNGNATQANPNGNHSIYWLHADIVQDSGAPAGIYTVAQAEDATLNPGHKLVQTPPNADVPDSNRPNYDERRPTWPQFISTYSVAYYTNRSAYNQATNVSTIDPTGFDIFASSMLDIDAPTLVRYEPFADVVKIEPARVVAPGTTIKIRVKIADLGAGVSAVYAQIKNPNSKYQSGDGREHKVFTDLGHLGITPDREVDGMPVEFDCEPIFVGPSAADPRYGTYYRPGDPTRARRPVYTPGADDFTAFSGLVHPPTNGADPTRDTGWLPLALEANSFDPATGSRTYSADWVTDTVPSDYYVDIIAYDAAVNPFSTGPASRAMNWQIFDNVWGFSTKSFSPTNSILFVSDYASGQKFFSSRFNNTTLGSVAQSSWPTESWMTDFDYGLLSLLGPTSSYYDRDGNRQNTTSWGDYFHPLGVGSYRDFATDPATTPSVDGRPYPPTQRYDIWRVLSRGAVPDSILNTYLPHDETQPPNTFAGETAARTVKVSPNCVIWHAPYTGDTFTGPGTLTDLAVQQQLHAFLTNGGRIYVNGQDVGWALTLDGAQTSSFVTSDLRLKYVMDSIPFANRALNGAGAPNPITWDPWPNSEHAYLPPPNEGGYDHISESTNYVMYHLVNTKNVITFGCPGTEFPDGYNVLSGTVADFTTTGDATLVWGAHYEDTGTKQRVVFTSGAEGLSPLFWIQPNTNIMRFKSRRAELIHDAVCWFRTATVFGVVRDQEAGQPMPGVLVRLFRQVVNGSPSVQYTAVTDASGQFRVNGVEPANWQVDAHKAGYSMQRGSSVTVHGGFTGEATGIRLSKAEPATVTGKVTQADGTTGVPGVTVKATDLNDATNTYTAVTDNQGNYTLNKVASGTVYSVAVVPPLPGGYGAATPASIPLPNPLDNVGVVPGQVYTGYNFVVTAEPGSATGRVVRASDTTIGIAGATVTATKGTLTATAITDANGNFSFNKNNNPANGLDPGTWLMTATAPGYAPGSPSTNPASIASQANTDVGAIQLTKLAPATLSGKVIRSTDGGGLAGATVTIVDANLNPLKDDNGANITATTDSSGNYTLSNVPAGGPYTVSATANGYTPATTNGSQTVTLTPAQTLASVNITMDPLHAFPAQLSLVSSPYDFSGTNVADLLGIPAADRTNGNFLFATWSGGRYVFFPAPPADTFHRSQGYFMKYLTNMALTTTGTTIDNTVTTDIPLSAGWNLIGCPYDKDATGAPINIDWTRVDVFVGATRYAHDQAVANGIISGSLYSYSTGSYVLDYQIAPWRGYWVRAYQACTLRIDPVGDRASRAVQIAGSSRAVLGKAQGWALELNAGAGEVRDQAMVIGVSANASDGFDGSKSEKPPVFGDRYVRITSDHADWGDKSGGYGVDLKSSSGMAKSWDVSVAATVPHTTATLTWPNAAAIGRSYNVTLTDVATGKSIDMRSTSSYSWDTGDGTPVRRFKVDASPATYGALRISGTRAQAPGVSRAAGVSISYNLSSSANVDVRILSASGSVIRNLSGRATRAAGVNQATWDQRNDQGSAVPAGLYMVEIRAQSIDGRQTARDRAPVLIVR